MTKRLLILAITLLAGCISHALKASALPATSVRLESVEDINHNNWPILKRYDEDHIARIALPLGGIGTGSVSLGGRGDAEGVNTDRRGSHDDS